MNALNYNGDFIVLKTQNNNNNTFHGYLNNDLLILNNRLFVNASRYLLAASMLKSQHILVTSSPGLSTRSQKLPVIAC